MGDSAFILQDHDVQPELQLHLIVDKRSFLT